MSSTPPSSSPSSSDLPPASPPPNPSPVPELSSPHTPLRRLLDETSDLIDSPTFTHIHTLLLDTLFSHLTDHVLRVQAFKIPLPITTDPGQRVTEILEGPAPIPSQSEAAGTKAKLATILAVVTRQAHAIGNGVPNEYVQAMEGVRELEAFAAVVYSSYFEVEGRVGGDVEEVLKLETEQVKREAIAATEAVRTKGEPTAGGALDGVVSAT